MSNNAIPEWRPRPRDLQTRFWSKVHKTDGCWYWMAGRTPLGYGVFSTAGSKFAHRVAYELANGPIPEGLVLDHLCRVPSCVRPDHLEAVTRRENNLRGTSPMAVHAQKTHCPAGHEYAGDNLIISGKSRKCRICVRQHRETHCKKYRLTRKYRDAYKNEGGTL